MKYGHFGRMSATTEFQRSREHAAEVSITAEAPPSPLAVPDIELVPAEPRQKSSPRLVSLDIVKGLMLIASVGVNAWLNVPPLVRPCPLDWRPPDGLDLPDLRHPLGVWFGLCQCPTGQARAGGPERVVILLAVGLVYNYITVSGAPFHLSYLRIPGILQLYAVVVIVLVLLHTVVKGGGSGRWSQPAWRSSTPMFQWVWSLHCAAGHLSTTCNASRTIDYAVFGANHLYVNGTLGYDPEGLVSIFGAIITACLGATVGHALLESRRTGGKPASVRWIGSIVIGVLALAAVLDVSSPHSRSNGRQRSAS